MASPTSSAGLRTTISSFGSETSISVTPTIETPKRAETATVCQTALSEIPAKATLVDDFWLVVGDHEDDLNKPTADDPRPLRAQLSEIGQAKGLNVRFLSIETFMALDPGNAPRSLAIGLLAHGTATADGHKMADKTGNLYLSTQLMEQGRRLGAVAQSVWSCGIGIAANDIAADPILMSRPGALYDIRGGRKVSSTSQDIAEIRDMVTYYAECKAQGVCPANVEIYLQSQLRSANCLRLVSPPPASAAGPGTIGHFPGPRGRALGEGLSIRDRLKPASAEDAAVARFALPSHIKPRTQTQTERLLRQRIMRGDVESVRILIGRPGVDINGHIACQSIPLHLAVGFRQVDIIKELFKVQGMDINARNQEGLTPLSIACQQGSVEVVRALIQATDADGTRMNLNIDAQIASGYTPLYLAAYAGHAAVVAELLQVPGVNVNAPLRFGQTALLAACRHGHAQVVQELLKSEDISGEAEDIVRPAMLEALKKGHNKVVEAILTAPELAKHIDYLSGELERSSQEIKASNLKTPYLPSQS